MNARDIAIRTIIGEALGEGPEGWAAVASVLKNRAADPRWPSDIAGVALQPKQFSAWNTGAGGNDLVRKYGPETDPYQKIGLIYDAVMEGTRTDPTGGATHYYSPAGMQALVAQGAQNNLLPAWFDMETAARGAEPVTIGGHIFTGMAQGMQPPPETEAAEEGNWWGDLLAASQEMAPLMQEQAAQPVQWMQRPAAPIQPTVQRGDYSNLFAALGR